MTSAAMRIVVRLSLYESIDGKWKLTRWRCSKCSAGASRQRTKVVNRSAKGMGDRSYNLFDRVHEEVNFIYYKINRIESYRS